jgi:hypothetical protein
MRDSLIFSLMADCPAASLESGCFPISDAPAGIPSEKPQLNSKLCPVSSGRTSINCVISAVFEAVPHAPCGAIVDA